MDDDARRGQARRARQHDVRSRINGRRGRPGRRFPGEPEAHLMATVWAVGEISEGAPTKLSLELATLARQLAEKSGGEAKTVLIGSDASGAAATAADYGGVLALDADASGPVAALVAPRLAALITERKPDVVLCGASSDGRDIAGLLVGLIQMPLLVNGS